MIPTSDATSLERRLIGHYLIPGLACILCLVIVLRPGAMGQSFDSMVAVLLAMLLGGAWLMRRTLTTHSDIKAQLQALSTTEGVAANADPVSTPAADLAAIETRLDESLKSYREQTFHSYLNTVPDGMAICDAEGKLTFVNDSLKALLKTNDDPCGQRMLDILQLDGTKAGEEAATELANPNRNVVVEHRRGKDTTDGVLRIARYPVNNQTGLDGFLWSVRDITHQQLATEMREHFVTSATHELRTPLANIRAYAETLLVNDDIDVEQEKAFINTINSEAGRLSRFVDDLLNVSQMQAGSITLDRGETDVERMCMEVDAKVRPLMDKKKIDFEIKLPPKLPKLSVDKDKLSAALVNLLGNAAKYTPDGGRVKFLIEAGESGIQFHVEDSGIGISEEELPQVFDRFFRSDDRRVRDEDGNGLGLTFTQDVVRLHSGRLDVTSELNKGSRFSVSLPL